MTMMQGRNAGHKKCILHFGEEIRRQKFSKNAAEIKYDTRMSI